MSFVINVLTNPNVANFVQNSSAQVLSEGSLKAIGRPVFTLMDKTATNDEKKYSATKEFLYQSLSMLSYFLMIFPIRNNTHKLLKNFPQLNKYTEDENIKNVLIAKNNKQYNELLSKINNKEFITKAKGAQELISILVSAFILTIITPRIVNKIIHPIMDKIHAVQQNSKK